MDPADAQAAKRVALLLTRFPVATETFLQREVISLRRQGHNWPVFALWPSANGAVENLEANHVFTPWHLITLLWWIPYWTVRRPVAMQRLAQALVSARVPNLVNLMESLLGMGYAIARAHEMEDRFDHIHAGWASAPATAAWALSRLAGIPFSMAGHAYDLYENGGDGLLQTKIPDATFVRTSTEAGRQRWRQLGCPGEKIHVIRRGLTELPELNFDQMPLPKPPYKLIAVGRLVEKMGYMVLLDILAELQREGFPFRATIVGGGPMRRRLQEKCNRLGLSGVVEFTGALPHREVIWHYRESDLFLFSGKVARSGDRAGFPNAIGEAMAWGVPVCASRVGAVQEGVLHEETGLLFDSAAEAAQSIRQLLENPGQYEEIRQAARQWTEQSFDAAINMQRFASLVERTIEA